MTNETGEDQRSAGRTKYENVEAYNGLGKSAAGMAANIVLQWALLWCDLVG